MPIFPIWIHDKKMQKPDGDVVYEVAANGIFLHKKTAFWNTIVPVDRISILEEQKASFELLLPIIPMGLVTAMTHFFVWVTKEYNTEALFLLYWNPGENNQGSYEIIVPNQKVERGRIRYDIPSMGERQLIGTFHSHGKTTAFHSKIDTHDENNFDGIHGTFGDIFYHSRMDKTFGLSLEASINGIRFKLTPDQVMEGLEPIQVKVRPNYYDLYPPYLDKQQRLIPNSRHPQVQICETRYLLRGEIELLPKEYQPPKEWLENLELPKFSDYFDYGRKLWKGL